MWVDEEDYFHCMNCRDCLKQEFTMLHELQKLYVGIICPNFIRSFNWVLGFVLLRYWDVYIFALYLLYHATNLGEKQFFGSANNDNSKMWLMLLREKNNCLLECDIFYDGKFGNL